MTQSHFSARHALASLACVSLASLLTACGGSSGGYYDDRGHYIQDSSYNKETRAYEPVAAGNRNNPRYDGSRPTYSTHAYDRRGYYDYNGYYVERDEDLDVPQRMFPPRGMCRVWFTERDVSDQPAIESCKGIKSRVPAGAYVIYGG